MLFLLLCCLFVAGCVPAYQVHDPANPSAVSRQVPADDDTPYSYEYTKQGIIMKWWELPIHWNLSPDMPEEEQVLIRKFVMDFSKETSIPFRYDGRSSKPEKLDRMSTIYLDSLDVLGIAHKCLGGMGNITDADIALSPVIFKDEALARHVIYHELCHLLGLKHVGNPESLMYPDANKSIFLDRGTLAGLRLLYGNIVHQEPEAEEPTGHGLSFRAAGITDASQKMKGWYAGADIPHFHAYLEGHQDVLDFGGDAVLRIPTPLFRPYVGVGIGMRANQEGEKEALNYFSTVMGASMRLSRYAGLFGQLRHRYLFDDLSGSAFKERSIQAGVNFHLYGGAW